ncbi:syncytin-B-like [Mauremys reevesii]|uniref:syncytin-B-like n=1 Tax=Mauremys reevesii TaxID=260615 RepID=UPI00193FC7CD|nr:syncytin-B-like [Mauremys reevesii]XP_039403954.1 syncytin-B-like [Mauremys reevesii]XP_039403956.1 syncytin-B-like [Mauremys reevesii]XP_039403957.1 syncytin-B-like [Mauremys reevesii]XP_039403958.1 syncytin-B-like [Mauremys reevesii]XP_039403959.1 syncytin-B-like [Mauremys reevesii]XP_039403960.1 syncytin-B-like [Mauremys reevesii]XP_039403961.1 syncytin-B-like [Mauremys reevesii]
MAWHQGPKNPIPDFSLTLTERVDKIDKARKRGTPNVAITWGQVKALSQQAEYVLEQTKADKTTENYFLALIASLNANSLCWIMYICVTVLCLPQGVATPLPSTNVWETFIHTLNQTSFCLSQQVTVGDILGTCLIPVCHNPNDVENATWFYSSLEPNSTIHGLGYAGYHNWGPQTPRRPRNALALRTPYAATHNITCARMTNCTMSNCKHFPAPAMNCSAVTNISYLYKHVQLPDGWFWTCSGYTFNYMPANLSDGTCCCLSRLALILPTKKQLSNNLRVSRSLPLDASCDSHVHLLSKTETVALAVSLVGVPGLATGNSMRINGLACAATKALNATSTAIALLNDEQDDIRHGVLQNRAAIDYLLMLHHYGCEKVNDMCCFNISDHHHSVENQLKIIKNLTDQIRYNPDPFGGWWDWLSSWLPNFGWLHQLVTFGGLTVLLLVLFCCGIQCVPSLVSLFIKGCPWTSPEPPRKY